MLSPVLVVSACLSAVIAEHSVTVRIPDFLTLQDGVCPVGADVGLSTSVLLQHRLVGTATTLQPWTTLLTELSQNTNTAAIQGGAV